MELQQVLVDAAYEYMVGQHALNNSITGAFHERRSALGRMYHERQLSHHGVLFKILSRSSY